MAISSFSNYPITDVRNVGKSIDPDICHAIQLYTMKDRALQERIVRSAEEAGCAAMFLTADSPVLGVRYNEWRNDFRTPEGLEFPIIELTTAKIRAQTHDSGFMAFNEDAHNWAREIPWLRSITKMQIWIKGILTAEDTEFAIKYGCDGVVVSNHGGRQLDGVPATIDALPECVKVAKEGGIGIHVDGGFRSGADVFKALALGAECCWVGRPAIWGLAVSVLREWGWCLGMVCTNLWLLGQYDGQRGVELMLQTIHDEFRRCMQLCGCTSVKDITKASLARIDRDGMLKSLL